MRTLTGGVGVGIPVADGRARMGHVKLHSIPPAQRKKTRPVLSRPGNPDGIWTRQVITSGKFAAIPLDQVDRKALVGKLSLLEELTEFLLEGLDLGLQNAIKKLQEEIAVLRYKLGEQ